MIPRASWIAIKQSVRRRQAFNITSAERKVIHDLRRLLVSQLHIDPSLLNLLPISTMQWSSVVLTSDKNSIALVDVEQANAIGFLVSRAATLEHPVLAYVEFMIRAAELMFDDEDYPLAFAISERANARLSAYARKVTSGRRIPPPQFFQPLLIDFLSSGVVLAFVAGHEAGHLLQSADAGATSLFKWVADYWRQNRQEPSRFHENAFVDRFIKPETIQKFKADGTYDGDIVLQMKFMKRMDEIVQRYIAEAQADALGIVAASAVALRAGIPPSTLFGSLLTILEDAEMLMLLHRVLPRLPRGGKRAHIALEPSNLFIRQCTCVRLVRAIRDGTAPVPPDIQSYWSNIPSALVTEYEDRIDQGHLEQLSLRPSVLTRGGIHMGLQGSLPEHPSEQEMATFGPIAGNFYFMYAHLKLPTDIFRIEETHNWNHVEGFNPISAGYAAAIRDLADVKANEHRLPTAVPREAILRKGRDDHFIECLRSTRSQIRRRKINPRWYSNFGHLRRQAASSNRV